MPIAVTAISSYGGSQAIVSILPKHLSNIYSIPKGEDPVCASLSSHRAYPQCEAALDSRFCVDCMEIIWYVMAVILVST